MMHCLQVKSTSKTSQHISALPACQCQQLISNEHIINAGSAEVKPLDSTLSDDNHTCTAVPVTEITTAARGTAAACIPLAVCKRMQQCEYTDTILITDNTSACMHTYTRAVNALMPTGTLPDNALFCSVNVL